MGSIKVLGGDFKESESDFDHPDFWLKTKKHPFLGERIHVSNLKTCEVASEEKVRHLSSMAGWSFLGTVAFGPVGLLAGLLAGGKKEETTFIAEFEDGRKMLATTKSKTYNKIKTELTKKNLRR